MFGAPSAAAAGRGGRPRPALRAAVLAGQLLLAGAVETSLCWRSGYNEQRCCEQKDATCWDAVFTAARCCPAEEGTAARPKAALASGRPRGDPSCWQDGYSYEECCGGEPKLGCWDSDFGPERCCRDVVPVELDGPLNATEEDMVDAFARLATSAAEGPLGCEDSPPGLWRLVKMASVALNVSRRYGMPGKRPSGEDMERIVRQVLSWVESSAAWEASQAACPQGALNAIDLAGPHIDKDLGEATAQAAYRLHLALQAALSKAGRWPPEEGGWPLLAGGLEFAPRLLGLTGKHTCHKSALRVFMYRIERFSHMTRPVLTCSQKMSQCTASVHIHRWLASGSCLTENPEEADLFYLPVYEACYNESSCGFGDDSERCYPVDFDPTKDLPYFQRRRGTDHIFVFGCNLLPFRDQLMIQTRQSIMVTVESFQAENFAGPNMLAWLSQWKDVVIPGYIPAWRISAMLDFNRPMIQRSLLVSFHGHSSRSRDVGYMYKRSPLAEVRDRVISYFWNASRCSAGPPVREYLRRMGQSRFCLIPAGLTAWTIHLYEAFFLGCVPVILSDEIAVPFQQEIDWPSLSLQVPTSIAMDELHRKLSEFSLGRLKVMHKNLARARCWLDYSRGWGAEGDDAAGCSPYQALLAALARRTARRGELYGLAPYWQPPPRT